MNIIITDADALIGLMVEEDSWHKRALELQNYITKQNIAVFVPYPILLEAAAMLSRTLKRPDLAAALLKNYKTPSIDLNTEVADDVAKLYDPKTSRKNTPFDHYVLALARKNNIQVVFSFDSFYTKFGLALLHDVV